MNNLTILVYDVETYPNYFMIGYSVAKPLLKDNKTPYKFEYSRYYCDSRDMYQLRAFLDRVWEIKDKLVMVGYNNSGFDRAILEEAYYNKSKSAEELCKILFDLGQEIITNHSNTFKYNNIVQFDLMPAKTNVSLKAVGVLLHRDNIQELPYEPNTILTLEQIEDVIKYNQDNDLSITEDLLNLKFDDFITFYDIISEFKLPLYCFSMTKGSLSETILADKNRVAPKILTTTYKCPYNFEFKTDILKEVKYEMESSTYVVGSTPFNKSFMWGDMEVVCGEGGIHGVIRQHYAENVIDLDGTSYYPSLIIELGTLPTSEENKKNYAQMKEDRVILKRNKEKGRANARKLILNNVFGKTKYYTTNIDGSIKKLGKMFDFKAFMTTTLTGQLLLLKLMEDLTLAGYRVIYLNTDGLSFESKGTDDWKEICKDWENLSRIELEETHIHKWWMKDVNNYVLSYDDKGETAYKIKGFYNTKPLSPTGFVTNSANRRICINAVVDYLLKGTAIEDTINNSNDIRDFILHYKFSSIFKDINLSGTALKGKVFRWFKSKDNKNQLNSTNRNTGNPLSPFASDDIKLVYKLSDYNELPNDLNRDWYIEEAYRIYNDLTGKHILGNRNVESMIKSIVERMS